MPISCVDTEQEANCRDILITSVLSVQWSKPVQLNQSEHRLHVQFEHLQSVGVLNTGRALRPSLEGFCLWMLHLCVEVQSVWSFLSSLNLFVRWCSAFIQCNASIQTGSTFVPSSARLHFSFGAFMFMFFESWPDALYRSCVWLPARLDLLCAAWCCFCRDVF